MSAPVKSTISWLQQTSSGVPSRQSCAEVHGTNVKVRSVFHVTPEAVATLRVSGLKELAKNVPKSNWVTLRVCVTRLKRLLGYRQSFRSLRSAKATLSGFEAIRTIKHEHFFNKHLGVQAETLFIDQLFEDA